MKSAYRIAILLAVFGVILFVAGSSIIGRWIYNIELMITTATSGAVMVAAAVVLTLFELFRKKQG